MLYPHGLQPDALIKKKVALKVSVWSRGGLATCTRSSLVLHYPCCGGDSLTQCPLHSIRLSHQIVSGMITRHNIACRLIMKQISYFYRFHISIDRSRLLGGWGGCSNGHRQQRPPLVFQNLQIPVGSTNRTIPGWLFPRRFPNMQRRTTSSLDAVLATEIPT